MYVSDEGYIDLVPSVYENGECTITLAKRFYEMTDEHKEKIRNNGKKKKSFMIDMPTYRKISSSAVNLFRNKVNQLIFFTLTFPENIEHINANECFSKFIENLKENYKLNGYVCVHEYTKKGRSHYHIIADFPFRNVFNLNRAWCSAFSDYMRGSGNALRFPKSYKGAVVKNLGACVRYICKYFGKDKYKPYDARCYFISRDVLSARKVIDEDVFRRLEEKFEVILVDFPYCKIAYFKGVLDKYDEFLKIISQSPG